MKRQIRRISPHQNGKVFGILSGVSSLLFVIPMFAVSFFAKPGVDQYGNPVVFPKVVLLLLPFAYLIFGYLMTVIGSLIYNLFFKLIGGFEFEVDDEDLEPCNAPDAKDFQVKSD